MATVVIDGKPHEVDAKKNLLHACLELGFDLPYFCWHPALGSVGACRQCAVKQFKDEHDTTGRLVMACMTPAADGTRIAIEDEESRSFRARVIEWLMLNHPHDCPVCDEGGECHLQDMTVMSGHVYRRSRFPKRTFRNQYLGPHVHHEMNRCIECYRCVRFYRDYAGGRDLNAFAAHDHVYFGRYEDGVLENEFSGNLVEVCPTGVFTDKTLRRHYTRKWDLSTAPSLCAHCGVGCNTIPGERYGMLRRIWNRYHHDVNGYFLCDRGRFGYEWVNAGDRIRTALLRRAKPNRSLESVSSEVALRRLAPLAGAPDRLLGIGSPRASLEANFALRALVGEANFVSGLSEREQELLQRIASILQEGPARSGSLRDVEESDAVLVLGEDVTQTAPRLALSIRRAVWQAPIRSTAGARNIPAWHDAAVRDAVQKERGPLFVLDTHETRLDEVATELCRGTPEELARLGFAVAHAIDARAPEVSGLDEQALRLAETIASALKRAEKPAIVSGTATGSREVIEAGANVARALAAAGRNAVVHFATPECNSLGLALLGGAPLESAFRMARERGADGAVVVENDLYLRAPRAEVDAFLDACGQIVVIDHSKTATTERADVVLPAGTYADSDGTWVSSEGRAQRFYQALPPEGAVQESWRWLRDALRSAGRSGEAPWERLDDVVSSLAAAAPALEGLTCTIPKRASRLPIPREAPRASGRTAIRAHRSVHEEEPPRDPDSPLVFSMEGYPNIPDPALIPRFWTPGWNSVQSLNKFQEEIGGPLRGGDPGVRLLEPTSGAKADYFSEIPGPFESRPEAFRLVRLYHIFGSEELSARVASIRERAPEPYLGLGEEDAHRLGVEPGDELELTLEEKDTICLPARVVPSLPEGVAGIPVGLSGLAAAAVPAWGRIQPRSRA